MGRRIVVRMALCVMFLGAAYPRPVAYAEEPKPLGYLEILKDVLEFPGLNAMPTAYFDFLKYKEPSLGGNVCLGTFFKTVDIRLGTGIHDPKVFGNNYWQNTAFGPSVSSDKIGFLPLPGVKELVIMGWFSFDLSQGGFAAGWRL